MENNKYFEKLSRILRKHDIENGPVESGRLIIRMDGQPVGRIESGPIRCLAPGDLRTLEASEAFHKAVPYAEMVAEYMNGLKRAPLLKADGLDENFRLLADFNGTVLAGKVALPGPKAESTSVWLRGPARMPSGGAVTVMVKSWVKSVPTAPMPFSSYKASVSWNL